MLMTLAFVPDGTDIPKPPSVAQLDKLNDVAQPAGTPLVDSHRGASGLVAGDDRGRWHGPGHFGSGDVSEHAAATTGS